MKKHSKLDHVFAIIRVETSGDYSWENRITVTKIIKDEAIAQREAERLNKLNAEKGCLYFWQLTRMEPDSGTPLPEHEKGNRQHTSDEHAC